MDTTEREQMTTALRQHLTALTTTERHQMTADSQDALRHAWPHRDSLRGRTVVQSNVKMLRNLRVITEGAA